MSNHKNKVKAAEVEPVVVKAADSKPVVVKTSGYKVAEGVTLTSKRAILDAGDKVSAELLSGGEDALKHLVETGCVVKA